MPATSTKVIRRSDQGRRPDWGDENKSPRRGARNYGAHETALARWPASRATSSKPVADEIQPGSTPSVGPSGAAPTKGPQTTPRRGTSRFWSEISAAQPLLAFSFLLGLMFIVLFGLDLCTGWLFWRASVLMDVGFTVCGLGLILLCWEAYRDFR